MKLINTPARSKKRKQQAIHRTLLDDQQCHVFRHTMIDFGYPEITFDEVRKIANQVHFGTHSVTNVIAIIMCKQIDEAISEKPKSDNQKATNSTSKQIKWQRRQRDIGNCTICGSNSEGLSVCRECHQRRYSKTRNSKKPYRPYGVRSKKQEKTEP